jgi:UPF0271 protein
MKSIDLNCDMGESFGLWRLGSDEAIMPHITSANIACGAHAGDPSVMAHTVKLAKAHGVAIGAHPGYPDLQGFGRRPFRMSRDEVVAMLLYQLGALWGVARHFGAELHHVKPHGALYNSAAVDRELASAIAQAVYTFSPGLILYCLPGSEMEMAGAHRGLNMACEGFVDRAYEPNGLLVDRREAGAVYDDAQKAASQGVQLANGQVTCRDGSILNLQVDTLCIHGDTPRAVEFAQATNESLRRSGFRVEALSNGRQQ